MHKRKLQIITLVFLALLVPVSGNSKSPSYKKVLKKWTRSDTVYQTKDFHAAILWKASFLNDDLLKAQAEKYGEVYDSSSDEKDDFLKELFKKRGDSVLFFVSFYSYDRHFDDLTSPRAKWQLRLKAGGQDFKPSRIEKIKRPNPLDQLFYPYLTPWSSGYYVWIPLEAGRFSPPYTLTVHSPFASSKLVWK